MVHLFCEGFKYNNKERSLLLSSYSCSKFMFPGPTFRSPALLATPCCCTGLCKCRWWDVGNARWAAQNPEMAPCSVMLVCPDCPICLSCTVSLGGIFLSLDLCFFQAENNLKKALWRGNNRFCVASCILTSSLPWLQQCTISLLNCSMPKPKWTTQSDFIKFQLTKPYWSASFCLCIGNLPQVKDQPESFFYQEKAFNTGGTEGRENKVFQKWRNLRDFQAGKAYLGKSFFPFWFILKELLCLGVDREGEGLEKCGSSGLYCWASSWSGGLGSPSWAIGCELSQSNSYPYKEG